jgi:ABC-type bacteriocin/lantibiotic exporter with double-glycine peptidase domain
MGKFMIALFLGVYYFGWYYLIFIVCMSILSCINAVIFGMWYGIIDKWAKATDKRLSTVKNLLSSIKFIKQNALEHSFFRKIGLIRKKETDILITSSIMGVFINFISPFGNSMSIVAFLYFFMKGGKSLDMSLSTVFLRMYSYFHEVSFYLPITFSGWMDASVGGKRIEDFLFCEEIFTENMALRSSNSYGKMEDPQNAVEIINGNFYWNLKEEEKPENSKDSKKGESDDQKDGSANN